MGGYAPPPPDEWRPATRAEADARNAIGNENRAKYNLGAYGEAEQYYAAQRVQQSIQQTRQDIEQQNQREMQATGGGSGFRHTSAYNEAQGRNAGTGVMPVDPILDSYQSRPRYTAPEDLGNRATQKAVSGADNKFAAIGVELEKQRQAATTTHDRMFYENELAKWNAQRIEMSGGYHALGMKYGIPIPANPYENVGDIALAFEKAGNQKDDFGRNYAFNPNVRSVLTVLPQYVDREGNVSPVGLQDYAWRSALGREGKEQVGTVNFMPAVEFINAQEGRMGVYGNLKGGVPDPFTPLPAGAANGGRIGPGVAIAKPTTAVSASPNTFMGMNIVSVGISNNETKQKSIVPILDFGNPLGMKVNAMDQSEATGGIQFASPVVTSSERAAKDTYYQNVSNWFKSAPGLNYIYSLGENAVTPKSATDISTVLANSDNIAAVLNASKNPLAAGFVTSIGSVFKGGNVFELKTDYEKTAALTAPAVEPLLTKYDTDIKRYNIDVADYTTKLSGYTANQTKYNSNLAAYNASLDSYNTALDAYNNSKTESGYNSLIKQESALKAQQAALNTAIPTSEYNTLQVTQASLNAQKANLDAQLAKINSVMAPVKASENAYNTAAGNLMGNLDQKSFVTYGAGMYLGDLSKGYQSGIEAPLQNIIGVNPVSQFVSGMVSTPRQILTIGQAGLIGGENLVRNAAAIPGVASAGVAMQAKGTYEQGMENPAGLAGTLAGIFILSKAAGSVATRGYGMYRTRSMEYVPIENIGYDAKFGYPIKPTSASTTDLARSFAEGKLYPAPKKMSLGSEVPYLHGENNIPLARLPTAKTGDIVLYTAHEGESLTGGIKVGTAYKMTGTGSSELASISAAPIAEGYFAKVGGQIPKAIGFESPIRGPTIYNTVVEGLEGIPNYVKRSVTGKDYTAIDMYMQTRSVEVPAGVSYLPMIKGEFEANIPTNSIFEVTGRNYYTKLGGFGKSHFGGVRVPIVEQNLIGFDAAEIVSIPIRQPSKSYAPAPKINLYYSLPAGMGVLASDFARDMTDQGLGGYRRFSNQGSPSVSRIIQGAFPSGDISRISSITKGAYSHLGISASSQGRSASSPLSASRSNIESSIISTADTGSLSSPRTSKSPISSFTASVLTPPISGSSKPSEPSKPSRGSEPSGPSKPSSVISPGFYSSPVTGRTPPTTPPVPPVTPWNNIPNLNGGGFPGSGGYKWGFKFTEKLVVKSAREIMFGKTKKKIDKKLF